MMTHINISSDSELLNINKDSIFSIDLNKFNDLDEERFLLNEIKEIDMEIDKKLKTKVKNNQTNQLKELFNLIILNKSLSEKNYKRLSTTERNFEVICKEYTFLSNLTKMRIIYLNEKEVLCYFAKKVKKFYKFSIALFNLKEDKLKTAELFWEHLLFLHS